MTKPKVVNILVVIAYAILLVIACKQQDFDSGLQEVIEMHGINDWLIAFSNKDFHLCDNLLLNEQEGFYAPRVVMTIKKDRYYDEALSRLVDCIDSIEYDNNSTVIVEYHELEELRSLDYNKNSFETIKNKYINGDIESQDFLDKLEDIYFDIYRTNCFQISDNSGILYLNLYEDEWGHVYNAKAFIDTLLDVIGVVDNIIFYESQVKYFVAEMIE